MNGWSLVLHEGDYDVKKPSVLEWRKEGKDNVSWERVNECEFLPILNPNTLINLMQQLKISHQSNQVERKEMI